MLGKSEQLFYNETLSGASGTVFTSKVFRLDGYAFLMLLVTIAGAVTGTTPTLTWALQSSADGLSGFSTVGAGLTALTATLLDQCTAYGTGSVQGAVTGPFFRVIATLGGTSPVFPNVFAEVVAHA